MLFDEANTEDLKAWLTTELGPICDADPEVLADYVLALLKHEASEAELQKLLTEQLEDFLGDQTEAFVVKTFEALSSKAYLPQTQSAEATQAADTSVAESLDGSRKRRADDDAEESTRSPPRQTRRLDDEGHNASREERGGRRRERDARERQHGPDGLNGSARREPRKQLCRDYHNKGFCPRGAECKFEHSADTMAGPQAGQFPMGAMMRPGPGPGGAMGNIRPPPPMMFPGAPFGMPPQGWNPNMGPMPGLPQSNGAPGEHIHGDGSNLAHRLGGQLPPSQIPDGAPFSVEGAPNFGHPGPQTSGRGGTGGGRGRGRGGGPPGTFQSSRRSNTTLVIENVPADCLDLIKVNEYFKRFGTITNISIDKPGSKALVSYSQPSEAKAAHESPEVIFGNRFVKVYFQRLDEGGVSAAPQAHTPMPAPAPPKSNFVPGKTSHVYHARPPMASTPSAGMSEERKKLLEDQKAKQAQLDSQLAEQKSLLGKFGDKDLSTDAKKEIMGQLKKLGEDIKVSTEAVKAAVEALKNAPKEGAAGSASNWQQEKEKREKEQLDRELELHAKGTAPGSTTEELKKKLESLKAEAASLGIDGSSGGAPGGFAARGRGARGGFAARGRGYAPFGRGRGASQANRSLRLDNRTTRLRISDLPADADTDKVQEHFKKFGEIESFEQSEGEGLTVTYKARNSGEQALRAGTEIPDVGSVKLSWIQAPFSSGTTTVTAAAANEGPGASAENGDAGNGGTGEEEYEEDRDSSWKR